MFTDNLLKIKPWLSFCFAVIVGIGVGACGNEVGGGESCSFENCNGCCDGNECVVNTSSLLCGQSGSSCRACSSGTSCSAGSCTAALDCSECPNSGCCLDGDQCQEGNTNSACGTRGNACERCSGGDVCSSANTCEASQCDSTTCRDGCCTSAGECKKIGAAGQNKEACGMGGAACQTCATSDLACSDGTCVPAGSTCLDFCTEGCCMGEMCVPFSMQDNANCGKPNGSTPAACSTCTGQNNCAQGTCASGPAWVITILSAKIADTDLEGDSWDAFSGLPDPEVAGGLGGSEPDDFLVPFEDDTLSPIWNYEVGAYTQADLVAKGLNLVFSDDDAAFDDPMGGCLVTITDADLAQGAGVEETAVCGPKVTDLRIQFVPVQ